MKRRFALASLLIGTVLGLILLLLELSLRLLRMELVAVVSANQRPCIYSPDSRTGYRYIPGSSDRIARNFEIDRVVSINSSGYYDFELVGDKQDVRILAIGDSMTAALEVATDEAWPNVLEAELRSKVNPRLEVLNLGLDGTGTDVHVELLRRALAEYRPDVVILAFTVNDAGDIARNRRYRECYDGYLLTYEDDRQRDQLRTFVNDQRPGGLMRWLFNHFYLVRAAVWPSDSAELLRVNAASPYIAGIEVLRDPVNPPPLSEYVEELGELAVANGFAMYIAPIPMRESPVASLDLLMDGVDASSLRDVSLLDVAPRIGVLLDEEGIEYDAMYWRYDDHMNAIGHRLFGRAVAEELGSSSAKGSSLFK